MPARATSSRSTGATLKSNSGPPRARSCDALGHAARWAARLRRHPSPARTSSCCTPRRRPSMSRRPVPLALVFSHPFDNGFTMQMGKPEAFYVVSQRGDDAERKTTDLMEYLRGRRSGPAATAAARPPHTWPARRAASPARWATTPTCCDPRPTTRNPKTSTSSRSPRPWSTSAACPANGTSRWACRWRSCRWTSPTPTGRAACSAPWCRPTASRCRMPRSRSST